LTDKLRYHLIGIGGAGMSAVAQILHSRGDIVTGSDRQENDATRRLRDEGIRVTIGHDADSVGDADVVVYTPAIAPDNPELLAAHERGMLVLERPAMLGRLMEPFRHRIAVSGAHGKTTTTSMIAAIFERAGQSPTAFIGGDVSFLGGNAKLGNGGVVIAEACEAFASFLHLNPSIAVITNIEADHLDFYGTVENVEKAFAEFLTKVDPDGCVVYCADDPRSVKVVSGSGLRAVSFGVSTDADFRAKGIETSTPEAEYTLYVKGQPLTRIKLGVPGRHNIMDSLAAIAAAFERSVPIDDIKSALADFHGAGRRFEILHDGQPMVVDDYAHHPTEIESTLTTAKSAYGKRIIAVFQPHLYSRTQTFLNEFAQSLALADEVVLVPIYAAREEPIDGVTSERIVERMRDCGHRCVSYVTDVASLPRDLIARVEPDDMVMFIGAGDIRATGEEMARLLSGGSR
jgi:UDP-N-acetylmuramate--alanine ligase